LVLAKKLLNGLLRSVRHDGVMTPEVPISRHLDLYSYWLSKRNGAIAPARRDMDPVELGKLLPFLAIVDKAAGEFRIRLMGTGSVQEIGRDLTGKPLIAYTGNSPETITDVQAVVNERVFANSQPVLAIYHHATGHGTIHNTSSLLLPLSDDGRHVNMYIATRAACLSVSASSNWPEGARLKKLDVIDIHQAPYLERRCLDWKGFCLADRQR
jgi:hypothetical protein